MSSVFSVATDGLVWREWDREVVVYDARHARTHLLDFGTGEVLRTLLQAGAALSLEQLSSRLFRNDDAGAGDPLSEPELAGLEALVTTLIQLELVEERAS